MTFRPARVPPALAFRVVEIEHRPSRRLEEAREQAAQLVHFLVVEADVGQHRDFRAIERDRSVAFVDFAHEQFGVADKRAGERRRRGNEILHHRAVHHRRLAVAGVEDPADHPGHGRLAAGPADRDAALRLLSNWARNCGRVRW